MEPNDGGGGTRGPSAEGSSEPDEMKIFLKVIKTVAFKVKKSATVGDIKEMFHEKEGVPSRSQKIFYGGDHLKEEKTLVEYDISGASTLHLFLNTEAGLKVNIILPPTGKTVFLEVVNWDTVRNIKFKLQALEGIPVGHQHILYKGRPLDDNQTLTSCNIQGNATLNLVLTHGTEIRILVCTSNKETIPLDVKTWYTILDVKAIIESIVHISTKKHKLVHSGIWLDDNWALSDCRIENGSTLFLMPAPIQIFVRTDRGNTVVLQVERSDTVDKVMEMIYQKIQIPPRYQSLIYAGKCLMVERSLADYNVEDQSTIHLVLVLRNVLPHLYCLTIDLVPYKESILLVMVDQSTIEEVKMKIKKKTDIPVNKQKLYYKGRLLSINSMSLLSAGLSPKSKLILKFRIRILPVP